MILPQSLNDALAGKLGGSGANGADIIAALQEPGRLIDLEDFLLHNGVSPAETKSIMKSAAKDMASKIVPGGKYRDAGLGSIAFSAIDPKIRALESKYPGISLAYQKDRMTPGRRDTRRTPRPGETQAQANKRGGSSPTGINIPGQRPSNYGSGATRGSAFGQNQVWAHLDDMEFQKNTSMLSRSMGFIRGIANPRAIGRGLAAAGRFAPGRRIPGAIKFNKGGMVPGYNMGGMVDGYNMGGMVQGYNEGGEAKSRGTGGMGMFMGGMGLQMGAGMVGGTAGSVMSNVGMAMQFMPMLGMLPKLTTGTKIFSTAMTALGNGIKGAVLAMKAFAMANPLLLAGTLAVAGAIAAFKAWRKEVAETKREQTNLFGITEKGAKEAGIKYQSLTEKVKSLREEQKLAADKAKAYFESYTTSGVRGLTLTIQQLRELKERVKTDMPELISTFNSIDTTKVNDLASNLKAQMIASGKSVEEATNLIYALIEASDKAGMGVGAISTKAFSGITDQGSAAAFVLQNLAKNIKDVSSIDPSAFASNVDTAIASLDSAVSSLIGTKDASGKVLDESAAIAVQFERMSEAGVKNNKLGEDTLKTLKSQRPEFANILNKSETIGGMYAKWRLMLQGVSIDLSKISSSQAETLAAFTAALDSAGDAALKVKGGVPGLEDAALLLKTLQEQYKNANKAANTDSINSAGLSKKQIKAIQDEIKAIRERAEAKKRALRETFDKENAELELQQAKLDLQSAVARGDNEAAAAAQIRIQQIQKEASLKSAEARIDDNARKEEAKQQALLDKDQEYKDRLAAGVTAAGNKAGKLGETIKTVTDLGNELTRVAKLRVLSEAKGATQKQKDDFNIAFSNVLQDIAKAAKTSPEIREAYGDFLQKDSKQKDGFARDAKGNFVPLPASVTAYLGSTLSTVPGPALGQIDQLAKGMSTFAQEIIGKQGKTLSDVWAALTKGSPQKSTITFKSDAEMKDVIAKNAGTSSAQYKNPYDKDNYLTEAARNSIIVAKKLVEGDTFTDPNGVQYNVKRGYDSKLGGPRAVRMAMGGYIGRAANGVTGMTGSQPYLVGERGPELFVPSSGGQIIPNNILGAKYNIPGNTISGVNSGTSNSYNNNVYNIDIDLNGTNVTADDIMRKLKSEMALINAKEGRVRTLGGNY
jgi:hypothetical protein